jgi:putative N6-adenine-specific DNA methylase
MGWKDYNAGLFEKVKVEAEVEGKATTEGPAIVGADISPKAVHDAVKNTESAGLKGRIKFSGTAFENTVPPEGGGTAIINPPYGERMGGPDLNALYKSIGDTLKKKYQGYEAWIISANMEALKHVGLRPSRRVTVHNGGLECRFQRYSMYAGSVKQKNAPNSQEAGHA